MEQWNIGVVEYWVLVIWNNDKNWASLLVPKYLKPSFRHSIIPAFQLLKPSVSQDKLSLS